MTQNWFYSETITPGTVVLIGPEAHHLAGVKRIAIGNCVTLFDGQGQIAQCEVAALAKREVTLTVQNIQNIAPESRGKIIIATSLAKGDRFDWLIATCTQLGVDTIIPVLYERTVKKASSPKIIERFNNLALSSAKQCKRPYLPTFEKPCSLKEAINLVRTSATKPTILIGSLTPNVESIANSPWPNTDVVAFIGPEGGMTEAEETLLIEKNAQQVRLTDHILRIETAAQTFSAILAAKRHASTA